MLSCSTLARTGFLPLVSLRGPVNSMERCHTLTLFAPILSSSGSRRKSRMPKERNSLRSSKAARSCRVAQCLERDARFPSIKRGSGRRIG